MCYGGGHVGMLLPIAKQLRELQIEIEFLALTTAINVLNTTEYKYYTFKDFFISNDVLYYGKRLLEGLESHKMDDIDSISYLGQNFIELIDNHGISDANNIYERDGRSSFYPLESISLILKELQPDLVISTNSPRSEKAAIFASRKLGIPSIAIGDLFMIRPLKWFSDNSFADKVCVFNAESKKKLIDLGRNEASIIVTGNPAFDVLVKLSDKTNVRNREGKFKILWASQAEPEYFAESLVKGDENLPMKVEEKLLEIVNNNKNFELYVRNHPNEAVRDYPNNVIVSNDNNLVDLLRNIDLVVTLTSIVGFEAVLLGKELITIDLSVLSNMLPYSKYGYSSGVDNLEALEKEIMIIYNKEDSKETKPYSIQNATGMICNEVKSILNIYDFE